MNLPLPFRGGGRGVGHVYERNAARLLVPPTSPTPTPPPKGSG